MVIEPSFLSFDVSACAPCCSGCGAAYSAAQPIVSDRVRAVAAASIPNARRVIERFIIRSSLSKTLPAFSLSPQTVGRRGLAPLVSSHIGFLHLAHARDRLSLP